MSQPRRPPLFDVINQRVLLCQSERSVETGARVWVGDCPFCQPATDQRLYVYGLVFHCFGCGAHGDEVTFLMMFEGIGFLAAVNWLAMPEIRISAE